MDAFEISAVLRLDTSDVEKKMSNIGNTLSGQTLKKVAKVGAVAVAAVTTATTALGVSLTKSVNEVADYGDKVDKMSQKIGISTDAYQKWGYVMERAGGNVDSLKMGMKTLSQQAEKNSDAFQKLGISQEEVASLSQEELFERTVKGLAEMESGTERAALASQLLGRAGVDMGPLLNQGSKAIEEQMEMAERYGMIMPEQTVKASAAFKDSVTTMQGAMRGLKNRALGEFLPAFTQVTDGLAKMFAGDMEGIKDVEAGIDGIVKTLEKTMPKVLEAGGKILETLIMAIVKNLPQMATAAVNIITKLIEFLSSNMGTIVNSAVMILNALVQGIATNLPVLIPAVVDAILTIVEALIANIDLLIDAALQLTIGLAEGLIKALPVLVEKAPQIILALVTALLGGVADMLSTGVKLIDEFAGGLWKAFKSIPSDVKKKAKEIPQAIKDGVGNILKIGSDKASDLWDGLVDVIKQIPKDVKSWVKSIPDAIEDALGDLYNIGLNVIYGLWDGIVDAFNGLWDWLEDAAGSIPKLFKSILGIASPSKVFKELGKWIPEGLSIGIEDNMDSVYDASDAMAQATLFEPESKEVNISGLNSGIEINIYATPQQDARQIAEEVQRQLVLWEKQRRAVFA